MIVNAAARLGRRFFARGTSKQLNKPQSKAKLIQVKAIELLRLTRDSKILESEHLLNSLEEEIGKNYSQIYTRFLKNKALVSYNFRRYGNAEMALLNMIGYNKMVYNNEDNKDIQHMLCLLYFVYQPHKLDKALEQLKNFEGYMTPEQLREVVFYQALALLYTDNRHQTREKLLELMNSIPQKQFIPAQKLDCAVALMTANLLLSDNKFEESAVASRLVFKRMLLNQPVEMEMVNKASAVEMVNCMISYEKSEELRIEDINNEQLNPRYRNITRLLSERYVEEKNYAKASKFARYQPQNDIHRCFLQAIQLFDKKKYVQAKDYILTSIFGREDDLLPVLPSVIQETDGLRYDAYKLLELVVKETEPDRQEEVAYEAEMFRIVHDYQPLTKDIHYFNIPFRKIFSLDNFAV